MESCLLGFCLWYSDTASIQSTFWGCSVVEIEVMHTAMGTISYWPYLRSLLKTLCLGDILLRVRTVYTCMVALR